jgi:hypothetical protein
MFWRRKQRERDLEREIRADLELEAAERRESGMSEEEARSAACRMPQDLTCRVVKAKG